jgi:hypothetical protein
VAADELDNAVQELAGKVRSRSSLALKCGKEAFYRQLEYNLVVAYDYVGAVIVRNMMSDDAPADIEPLLPGMTQKYCVLPSSIFPFSPAGATVIRNSPPPARLAITAQITIATEYW